MDDDDWDTFQTPAMPSTKKGDQIKAAQVVTRKQETLEDDDDWGDTSDFKAQ